MDNKGTAWLRCHCPCLCVMISWAEAGLPVCWLSDSRLRYRSSVKLLDVSTSGEDCLLVKDRAP